ncbi:MAG: lipoyl synthase [Clostridia bacterium]|nr:lipoyl synthase [Clostridia bacterium]
METVGSPAQRHPIWLKVDFRTGPNYLRLKALLRNASLHTICEEARCPNIYECFENRTATFLILGDVCTRACRYCAVASGRPAPPDPGEPRRVAEAVATLGLRHAVVTSVDRDDLPDGGAAHFAATVRAIRRAAPGCRVEVLVPDFRGDVTALATVLAAGPDVLNHNIETVRRVFPQVRGHVASYAVSLELLRRARELAPGTVTKSGLMVGLGETWDELLATMDDLRAVGCDVLTIGQYLRPTAGRRHVPVSRYYTPEEFRRLKEEALARGFRHVEAGPLVRSSYHAHQHVPAPVPPQ